MNGEKKNGMDLSFGSAHLTATGNLTVLALCVLAIIASSMFSNYRIEQSFEKLHKQTVDILEASRRAQAGEHGMIERNQDILICVSQLTVEERTTLRRNFSNRSLLTLCPWIRESKTFSQEPTP